MLHVCRRHRLLPRLLLQLRRRLLWSQLRSEQLEAVTDTNLLQLLYPLISMGLKELRAQNQGRAFTIYLRT